MDNKINLADFHVKYLQANRIIFLFKKINNFKLKLNESYWSTLLK